MNGLKARSYMPWSISYLCGVSRGYVRPTRLKRVRQFRLISGGPPGNDGRARFDYRHGAGIGTPASGSSGSLKGRRPLPSRCCDKSHASSRPLSTFVSKYFRLDASDIMDFLKRKRLTDKMQERQDEYMLRICPFCHDTKGKQDNMYKLYVSKITGAFICHRCGTHGSWFDFKNRMNGNMSTSKSTTRGRAGPVPQDRVASSYAIEKASVKKSSEGTKRKYPPSSVEEYAANLFEESGEFADIRRYLTGTQAGQRHLTSNTIRLYKVGAATYSFKDSEGQWTKNRCITFPWVLRKGEAEGRVKEPQERNNGGTRREVYKGKSLRVTQENESVDEGNEDEDNGWITVRVKVRSIESKGRQRLDPSGGGWGLFGWHLVPEDAKEIIVTEGEFDAMAVHQATGFPAVSLPNGCNSLPVEVLPLLERFEKIILWMDNDGPGAEGGDKIVRKLGAMRCYLVEPTVHARPSDMPADEARKNPPKDANEALCKGWNIGELIRRAKRPQHEKIVTFAELRHDVSQEFKNPTIMRGVPSISLPGLNDILKGHRSGELSIITGPTGVGKTTLLSQLSLDYCSQGVNTLWGSFEIKNVRLLKKMLTQFAGTNLERNLDLFDEIADEFEELPLYFLRFFGGTDIGEVLDAMRYAVYVHDVEHIILDNLQFMFSGFGRHLDKFDAQEQALEKIRHFATHENVHITLVIHPRKEDDDTMLQLSSVFGTAKATQEADNVIILQKRNGQKFVDIKKNRFDGTLGMIEVCFDPDSTRLLEKTQGDGYSQSNPLEGVQTYRSVGAVVTKQKLVSERLADGKVATVRSGSLFAPGRFGVNRKSAEPMFEDRAGLEGIQAEDESIDEANAGNGIKDMQIDGEVLLSGDSVGKGHIYDEYDAVDRKLTEGSEETFSGEIVEGHLSEVLLSGSERGVMAAEVKLAGDSTGSDGDLGEKFELEETENHTFSPPSSSTTSFPNPTAVQHQLEVEGQGSRKVHNEPPSTYQSTSQSRSSLMSQPTVTKEGKRRELGTTVIVKNRMSPSMVAKRPGHDKSMPTTSDTGEPAHSPHEIVDC